MQKSDTLYQTYLDVLKKELVPAMGCTEPVTVAYCAALARKTLGAMPDTVFILASGNVIKNVKSVVVPNTGGMKGIATAAAAGIVAGDPAKQLEVITGIDEPQREEIQWYKNGQQFRGGDGIISKGIENTLHNIVRLSRDGMQETDREIIRIMAEC